jgi:predicted acetyltransferase
MDNIRRLTDEELEALAHVVANAYPGFEIKRAEQRAQLQKRLEEKRVQNPTIDYYGLFENGELLGGMRLHDFRVKVHGRMLDAGGVGMVAVDLLHKKRHVAKRMLEFFLRRYREQGAALSMLYPFRPDFYYKMGFGYGPQMNRYRVRPTAFPRGPRRHLRSLTPEDQTALAACYARHVARTHGMIARPDAIVQAMLEKPKHHVVGYVDETGAVRGYLVLDFKSAGDNFLLNDLHVTEMIYEHRDVLAELLAFLAVQADQVNRVIVDTQDDRFYFLLADPRNGGEPLIHPVYQESNVQGVGLMYRVLDVRRWFERLEDHDFGGQTCRIKITIRDSFLPENAGSVVVHVQQGRAALTDDEEGDVEIRLGIAEFSSLAMGVISFERLHTYGLAEISDTDVLPTVTRLFAAPQPPICMTSF